jgi:hypothetical protein
MKKRIAKLLRKGAERIDPLPKTQPWFGKVTATSASPNVRVTYSDFEPPGSGPFGF